MVTERPSIALRQSMVADRTCQKSIISALKTVLFATVFFSRLEVPIGATGYISPILILVLVTSVCLWWMGAFQEDWERLVILLGCIALCLSTALANDFRGTPISITSLGLLVIVYLPFALRASDPVVGATNGLDELLIFLTKLIAVIAVIAVLQTVTQLLHLWNYQDLLASVVPQRYLVQGYHTSYPVAYGSSLFKANGVFELEPSFCSQFLALGILATLRSGITRKPLIISLFAVALVCTSSGTGIVLLFAGLAIEVVRRGPAFAVKIIGVAVLVGAVLLQTPLGAYYATRSTEFTTTTSSGNQRFIAPYAGLVSTLRSSPRAILLGEGPGAADRAALKVAALTGAPLTAPPLVKLIVEYGALAGLAFAGFIAFAMTRRTSDVVIAGAVLVFYFLLSGGLLQTQTIYVAWALTSVIAKPDTGPGVTSVSAPS